MDFGIAVATSIESWKAVKRAEALGFSHAWFYDTQLLNPDVFIGMTQAAMATSRIRLGTGVLIPSNRIEPVTANALATLNRIAPGRIDFGVGTGFTGRRTMGLRAIPLARLATYVERVQALLRGETIEWEHEGVRRKIRFLNPEFGLIDLTDPIALHVSAFGPKARALTARLGAGWLNFGANVARATRELSNMRKDWQTAGRTEALYSTLFTLGCVLDPGESAASERAIAEAGPMATVFFHNLVETTEPGALANVLPRAQNDALERYREMYLRYQPADARHLEVHRGHLMFVRPEERPFLSPEIMSALTMTATADVLRDRIRTLRDAGYSQFTVQLVERHDDALERWAEVFATV
jgi:5,10-methylenetetrahydromethanopterin reductase